MPLQQLVLLRKLLISLERPVIDSVVLDGGMVGDQRTSMSSQEP